MKRIVALFLAMALVLSVAATPALAARPVTPKVLEAVLIHYERPANAKPGPSPDPKVYDYYKLLGPKWDLTKYPAGVPFVINPSGGPVGAEAEVKASFQAWEAASSVKLFADNPVIDYGSWWGARDGKNNVSWQVIPGGTAIAGTYIWYLDNDGSGGMSAGDETIETDLVFNSAMKWGIDRDGEGTAFKLKNQYDVRNIGTHEVGHVVGLADIYELKYSEITMYGYSTKGEIKKISLAEGDKLGTVALYP